VLSKNDVDLDSPSPRNLFHNDNGGGKNHHNSNAQGKEKNKEHHFITSFGITGLNHLSIAEVFNMQTNNDNDENDDYSDGEDRVPSENAENIEAAPEGKVGDTVLGVSENPPSRPSYSSTNNEEATNKRLSTNSRRSMVDKTTDQIIIDIKTAIVNYHDKKTSSDIEMAIPTHYSPNDSDNNIDSLQLASNGNSIMKTFI